MIQWAYQGQWLYFGIQLEATGLWDQVWDGLFTLTGGICLTDFIPFAGKAAKAMKLSKKTVKLINKVNKGVRNYQKVQDKLGDCGDMTGAAPCGNAEDVLSTLWNAQCIGADPTAGSYDIAVQFDASFRSSLSLIGILVFLALT